jgi:hypothetical protein
MEYVAVPHVVSPERIVRAGLLSAIKNNVTVYMFNIDPLVFKLHQASS